MSNFKSNWMQCTTCKAIVSQNNTGICLGCQGGFTGPKEEEQCHIPIETSYKRDARLRQDEKIAKMKKRQKELEDALKERKEQEGDIAEHQNRDGCGETTEASSCNSDEHCWEKQKKEKKKWWKLQRKEINENKN